VGRFRGGRGWGGDVGVERLESGGEVGDEVCVKSG